MDKPNNSRHDVEELLRGGENCNKKKKRCDVFVSFFVQAVHEIDIIKQRFHASFIMYAAWDVSLDDFVVGGDNELIKERKDSEGKLHFEWKDAEGVLHELLEDTIQWKDSYGKLHQKALDEPSSWIESMFKRWDIQDPVLTFPNCVQWTKDEKNGKLISNDRLCIICL